MSLLSERFRQLYVRVPHDLGLLFSLCVFPENSFPVLTALLCAPKYLFLSAGNPSSAEAGSLPGFFGKEHLCSLSMVIS